MRKHVRVLPLLALIAAPVVMAAGGCEEPTRELRGSHVAKSVQEPIINGSPDPSREAVVWVWDEDDGGSCSATIIAVNPPAAYVLTAAHCTGLDYVFMADDYLDCFEGGDPDGCTQAWTVDDDVVHPDWNGDVGEGHDFRLLRIIGADGSTPFIPAAQFGDGMTGSSSVDIVGYGLTEDGENSVRNHKVVTVGDLYTDLFSTPATICSGDSGGPAILSNTVVGVTSFGFESCFDDGFSGRVGYVYADFIAPYIGAEVPPLTCDQCVDISINTANGACRDTVDACFADPQCNGLNECLGPCTTQACINACANEWEDGIDLFNEIFDCAYCQTCAAECPEEQDTCNDPQTTSATTGATTSATTGSGGGSTTGATVGTGADTGAGTETGTGVGTGPGAGSGGASGDGDGDGDDDDDDDDGDGDGDGDSAGNGTEDEGCAVQAAGAGSGSGLWLLGAAAVAAAARRRRRG